MDNTANRNSWFSNLGIFIILTLCGLLIGLSGYFPIQPAFLGRPLRIGLPVLILVVIFFLNRSERGKKYLPLSLAFFAVALGLAIDIFVGNLLLDGLHWSTNAPQGWAAGKFGEAVPVILCILAVTRWSGEDFKSLYLVKRQAGVRFAARPDPNGDHHHSICHPGRAAGHPGPSQRHSPWLAALDDHFFGYQRFF